MATLAEVVVTATRVLQPLTDLVADVTIVDRTQIERSGATGLGDDAKATARPRPMSV